MSAEGHYDLIVIGTGAGGGTLARHLAPSGKQILLIERGGFIPQEVENWDVREVWGRQRYRTTERWFDEDRRRDFDPGVYYNVGGNTKVFGAVLIRLRREDFEPLEHYGGVSPAWPVTYAELEPYYTLAERLYRVHGQRGIDPTEPPASQRLPYPAVSHEPRIKQLYEGLVALGAHPFPLPLAVMLDEARPDDSRCVRCGTCDSFPCLMHAKADAEVIGVRPALAHQNVTLLTRACATRLLTSPSGREVTGVVVQRGSRTESYRAALIVLAAGAVNSARLLLMSACDKHPRGLANGSDQVGRNLLCHHRSVMMALSPRENPTRFQKTLGMNDYYFGDEAFAHPMGNIQMLGKVQGWQLRARGQRLVPLALLNLAARHSLDFFLTAEDLPEASNRVTVDSFGGVRVSYRPNNLEAIRQLERRAHALLRRLARREGWRGWSVRLVRRLGLSGLGHQAGTCRMGTSAATSVVDPWCRAHELDNLYVADASVFPSIGAVNPALTVMANALRVGDHLLGRLG